MQVIGKFACYRVNSKHNSRVIEKIATQVVLGKE